MEAVEDDDDLKLVQASAGLLSDLETFLPKLLWKRSKSGSGRGAVHKQVRRRDLEYVISLIEPFQGEPQLLDARLKHILPPIVTAYIEYIGVHNTDRPKEHLNLQSAICIILYTLCKVRGYNIVVGFLNNEPRYIEPILNRLDYVLANQGDIPVEWQVPYILLLWLSHLMLTPFDLASISPPRPADDPEGFPVLVERIQVAAVSMLSSPTKAQDAAAILLVRLVTRPDMLQSGLCGAVGDELKQAMQPKLLLTSTDSIYDVLGPLRYYAGITATSADDRLRIPEIYRYCWDMAHDADSRIVGNAVAKKLFIKIFRNTAIAALRAASKPTMLTSMLEESSLVEDVIDYLLTSLGDRDTPVRYAAAKALSRLVLELESAMGYEVIQAVLDAFKEDMPRDSDALDFRTVNALRWHGLTLTLAHMLFKRSAATQQLADIVRALVSALQFEQRTATGSSVGTNVRDAANFGLWSLSRRYTTDELLSVDVSTLKSILPSTERQSVIQALAVQLILSACLDPVGNIRRGSSAALQELVGRHPNQVLEGIALVQIVDYQAVGLRRRAMVEVSTRAAELPDVQMEYWTALVNGLLGWRGVGSPDVPSREAAAAALARLGASSFGALSHLVFLLKVRLLKQHEIEILHGLVLSFAALFEEVDRSYNAQDLADLGAKALSMLDLHRIMSLLVRAMRDYTSLVMRSELPAAMARLLATLCRYMLNITVKGDLALDFVETLTKQLLARQEKTIQQALPPFVAALLVLKQKRGVPLGCIGAQALSQKVVIDGSKGTIHGACGAVALGALAPLYKDVEDGESTALAVTTLANLTEAVSVDWRIVAIKGLRLVMEPVIPEKPLDVEVIQILVKAVHRGLNDYTIDERGDVGSLVRLQAIACASCIFDKQRDQSEVLQADIYRLSLEKLDRVRLEAAQSRAKHFGLDVPVNDAAGASSEEYFVVSLQPLALDGPGWKHRALLEGCISCAGTASEPLLQASRSALVQTLDSAPIPQRISLFTLFATILKDLLTENINALHPALELLAFLLDMQIPQQLPETSGFKWMNLLSTVQKSHHKSNDIPKILAAVHIYRDLADVASVRGEVLKKLVGMLKTNPYPRVRSSVAEALYVITKDEGLRGRDWTKPAVANAEVVKRLQERYAGR